MTAKPNEITDAMLKDRAHKAYKAMPDNPDDQPMGDIEDIIVKQFEDLIGIVGRARKYQRHKDAAIARRRNHGVTSQEILKGDNE